MNRNFAKISVVIVALVLALAFCLTGCKVDDVAADLDTTKGEVSANKADAAKALEDAVKALEAKIAANEADCAAEIAAVNAAIKAAKDAGAATDANLASAEKTLNAAIDAVRTSLDNAKKELSDKITANDAKINAEVAALNAAIENAEAALKAADSADKAALESSLAAAKAELEAAVAVLKADIAKLTEYVNAAVADLKADIAAGKKDLTDSIVALENALTVAKGESADADAALKAELEQAIVDATQAIIDVVEIADKNLQDQINADKADLEATKDDLETTKNVLNTLKNETVPAIVDAYKNADGELAGKIDALKTELVNKIDTVNKALDARLAVVENALKGYKDATAAIDAAWADICATYDSWKTLSETHNAGEEANDIVEKAYELAQIRLGRALTVDDVNAAKTEFATAVANAQKEVPSLKNLEDIYNNLVKAGEATDLDTERTAILAAKAGLDGLTNVELVVDGKVVDLAKKYAEACVAYNAERVALVDDAIAAAQTSIDNAKIYGDFTPIDTAIKNVATSIKTLVDDTDIPVEVATTDALTADRVELLVNVAGAWIEVVNADVVAGKLSIDARFSQATRRINTAKDAGADVAALEARLAEVKAARASAYADLASTAIENATDIATLNAAMKDIEANLADAKDDILALPEGKAKDAAVADYVAAQQAKLAKMEEVAGAALDAATTLEAVEAVEAYKNEINMAMLALMMDEVGVNTDDFGMTTINLSIKAAEKVLAFAAADIEKATTADAVKAVADTLAVAKTKIDAIHTATDGNVITEEATKAIAALDAKYEQLAGLVALVAEGENVAAIIAGLDAEKLEGTKTEYNTINAYKTAKADFVAKLDKLYVGFEGKAGYDAIRATANEAGFEKIDTAFVAKISGLVEIASDLINKIKAINAKVAEDGYSFAMIVDIEAAWDAFHTWEQNAVDADGVGFIIEYVSEGAYTNENLNTILVQIQTDYDAHVKAAQDAWADVNTAHYQSLTVDNITWNETALEDVRKWFTEYGTDAADYDVENVGTATDEAALEALETKLAELQAERKALVEKLAADAVALQERIDNLGFITTDSKATVAALRADVDAWTKTVADNAIDFTAEYGQAVAINETDLVAAEVKLVDLEGQIANIKNLINALVIPTMGDDLNAPYFADDTAKDAYVAEVKAITDALAKFNTDNEGYRNCFTDAELAKVEAANSDLFVAKYEATKKVYSAYVDACNGVLDADVITRMTTYLNEALKQIDKTTDNIAYVQQTGTNAANKFKDIKEGAGLPVCDEHTYDYACDAVCNVCFYTRTITADAHVYDGDCDTICNTCKETTRTAGDHTYTDECDTVCDVCKEETRVAPHKWAGDCDAECDCGFTRTRLADHVDADGNLVCDVCKDVLGIKLTVDSLGIASQKYESSTAEINGASFEFIQIGNYGDGIQMRDKNGNTSSLWNTIAFDKPIERIDLVYSSTKSTYNNSNAIIFKFGNTMKGADYTTKLSTTAGDKTYTITPNAETYTFLYIEHDINYSYYWESITIIFAD